MGENFSEIDAKVMFHAKQCGWGGLVREDSKDESAKEAIKWFQKADKEGTEYANVAQMMLGYFYLAGYGVKQDDAEAVKWLEKAVGHEGQASDQALFKLAVCYYYGRGVRKDYGRAVKYLQRSVAQGNDDYWRVYNLLGLCYAEGHGVEQDYAEAAKWLEKALALGDESAEELLQRCKMLCEEEKSGIPDICVMIGGEGPFAVEIPYWNEPLKRPRLVSVLKKLESCGFATPGRYTVIGETAEVLSGRKETCVHIHLVFDHKTFLKHQGFQLTGTAPYCGKNILKCFRHLRLNRSIRGAKYIWHWMSVDGCEMPCLVRIFQSDAKIKSVKCSGFKVEALE